MKKVLNDSQIGTQIVIQKPFFPNPWVLGVFKVSRSVLFIIRILSPYHVCEEAVSELVSILVWNRFLRYRKEILYSDVLIETVTTCDPEKLWYRKVTTLKYTHISMGWKFHFLHAYSLLIESLFHLKLCHYKYMYVNIFTPFCVVSSKHEAQ